MRDRGESFGSSADLSVSYSSITLRAESRARSTTNLLTFSLPLNAWKEKWLQSASWYKYLNSLRDTDTRWIRKQVSGFPFYADVLQEGMGQSVLIKALDHFQVILCLCFKMNPLRNSNTHLRQNRTSFSPKLLMLTTLADGIFLYDLHTTLHAVSLK